MTTLKRPIAIMAVLFLAGASCEFLFAQTFKSQQLRYPRARAAFAEKEKPLREHFRSRGLSYPPRRILIRVFKLDRVLEVWCGDAEGGRFEMVKQYAVCTGSGGLGPKRVRGDGQVPEGFYFLAGFNPFSNFHLSLRVSYPNESDRILGVSGRLGGDIFIHGNCVSIGCVPITDDKIKELYVLAVEARSAGQARIPIHIFPAKLDDNGLRRLRREAQGLQQLWAFWMNLKEGFDFFESHQRIPAVTVNSSGVYLFH